jgi:hypothetical protein
MRLIRSMLSIISKLYVSLVVDDSLNVWCIDRIGSSMVQHTHKFCPKEGTDTQRRLVIKNC